jgi:hypothetical protein
VARCREPNLTKVSFIPLISDQGYHKVIVFSAIGAVRTKTWVWRMPSRETPTTSNHGLYEKIDSFFLQQGFMRSKGDPNLYTKFDEKGMFY